MADERVVIKIDTEYDGTGARRALRDMRKLEASEKKLSSGSKLSSRMAQSSNQISNATVRMRKSFDFFDKGVKMSGTVLRKFVTTSLKAVTLEMGLLAVGMLSVHALFIVGKGLAKAYAGAMQVIAGGTAAAAVAIATAAAAIREQQAAMFAYRGKGAGEFGSGLNQARVAMRALSMDSSLAGLGVENLNKAYAAMSKTMNTPQINASTNLFKALMDFGAAGQDPGAAAEKVGAMIASLSDSKKSLSDVKNAAKELGPEMEKALKDANVKTKEQLRQLIMSGELAKIGGVAGQFDAVNQTLIGQMKTFFNLVRGQFADFGETFLAPAKNAMQQIFRILTEDIRRMMVAISGFGTGAFMDGLVNTVDRVSNWTVEMVMKWLPRAEGMWSRISGWWGKFSDGWQRMVDAMRPLVDGARVIERAFAPIWDSLKRGGVDNIRVFREELLANEQQIMEFGQRIAKLIDAVSEFSQKLKKALMDIMPLINDILSGLTQVFKLLSGALTKFAGAGLLGSLLPIMLMFLTGKQMQGTKGGYLGSTIGSMNVNATNVNVNGGAVGGPVPGRGGATPAGAVPPAAGPAARQLATGPMAGPAYYSTIGQPLYSPTGKLVTRDARGRFQKLTAAPVAWGRPGDSTWGGRSGAGGGESLASRSAGGTITASPNAGAPITSQAYASGATRGYGWMGGWMSPAQSRIGGPNAEQFATTRGGFAGFRDRMRYQRNETRFGAGLFGNERYGIRGINNSMGARLGVGMGLSAASQYAPEEMRGMMALGGMVGMYNPMAGLAVAGLGGATQARGTGTGMLSGAVGGAAMGAMIGGPVGMAIGGALGAVAGGIMGGVRKLQMQAKEAKSAVNSIIGGVVADISTDAFNKIAANRAIIESGGTIDGAAVLGTGSKRFMDRTAGLRRRAGEVAAMGKTDRTNWGANIGGGAALGAAVGTFMGAGVFSVPGAIIGAGIGAVAGAAASLVDHAVGEVFGKDSVVEKAQKEFIDEIYKNQKAYGLSISAEEKEKLDKDRNTAVSELEKRLESTGKVYGKMDEMYTSRVNELAEMSGKSAAEIEVLAQQLGVNLYDSTVEFMTVAEQLGLTMMKTAAEMRASFQDVLASSTDFLAQEQKMAEATYAINAKSRTARDQFLAGGFGREQQLRFLQEIPSDIAAYFGGSTAQAYANIISGFGIGGAQYTKGGSLEGMEGVLAPDFMKVASNLETDLTNISVSQIMAAAAGSNMKLDEQYIRSTIAGMSQDQKNKLFLAMESGFSPTSKGTMPGQSGINYFLNTLGFDAKKLTPIDTAKQDALVGDLTSVAESLNMTVPDFKAAMDNFIQFGKGIFTPGNNPSWFDEYPVWWNQQPTDTSSPRGSRIGDTTSSKLEQTMSRHAAMNSQLTGTRTITSAFRTWNLGSPSSDHATGRAYDLTGQNLGSYAKLVHANGGFAEFHGRGGSRHLHVVPGPGPYGDTGMPAVGRMPMVMQQSGGSNVTNNITVNAAPGQSPEAIANVVMQKIEQKERNLRERS